MLTRPSFTHSRKLKCIKMYKDLDVNDTIPKTTPKSFQFYSFFSTYHPSRIAK